jgi:histone H3/H4
MAKKPVPKESDEIEIEEMLEEMEEKPKPKPKAKPKAKPKPKPKPKAKKPSPLVIRSRVYKLVRKRKNVLKVSVTVFDKLNEILEGLIEKACLRAEGNKRKTVHAKDL